MDTIVKVCRAVETSCGEPGHAADHFYEIKVFPIQDYRLIQVRLQEALLQGEASESARSGRFPRRRLYARRARKKQELLLAEFRSGLAALLDERDDNYCIAEHALKGFLPLPEFDGYLERRWVQRLLSYAVYPRFAVLGTAPYLPELLCGLAPRMKSLMWILPDHSHAEMLEDFAEDFYQEYGLAIDLRFLGINESYGQLRLGEKWCAEPLNVLDFTQDRRIPSFASPCGGIWLDLAAVDEKERRIEARGQNFSYFSLRKQWRNPQKTVCLLDTARKNEYNT